MAPKMSSRSVRVKVSSLKSCKFGNLQNYKIKNTTGDEQQLLYDSIRREAINPVNLRTVALQVK